MKVWLGSDASVVLDEIEAIVKMASIDARRSGVALRRVSIPLHFSRLSLQGGILYNGFEHP